MTSVFGWLDQDDAQRAAMNEVVKLFQDQGSVDELGIGAIRDAFSNAFFPGTSVLHTRARYLLLVPWLVDQACRHGRSMDEARTLLRDDEVRLIRSLLAGGMTAGVIGSQAQDRLKTMPSQTYWPALQRFGIVRWDLSIDSHLRRASQNARSGAEVTEADYADGIGPDLGCDRQLPPRPDELLTSTTFDLTADEASYLQGVFARLPGNSLLTWLSLRPTAAIGDQLWETPAGDDLPAELLDSVDQARRLHHAWHGAPLLYNLMLAELAEDDDLVQHYREQIAAWEAELRDHRVFEGWSRPDFWALVHSLNPRLRSSTQRFVEQWFSLVENEEHTGERARRLVHAREVQLKNRRSRLLDPQARQTWTPGAGTGRLGFRWNIARSFLGDVRAALEQGLTVEPEPERA